MIFSEIHDIILLYIHNSGLYSECMPVKSLSSGSRAGMSTGVNSHVAVVLTIG